MLKKNRISFGVFFRFVTISVMAAEAEFRDLVGESDSEDENVLGFTEGDIVDGDSDKL